MTPPDAPTAMTLEEALVLADKKGVDVHFLNAPLRVVGERVVIHDGAEDGYPIYGGTWPEAFSKWLDRPVVERDPTAELIDLVERVLGESNLSADPKEGNVIIIADYRDYREMLAALAAYEASRK